MSGKLAISNTGTSNSGEHGTLNNYDCTKNKLPTVTRKAKNYEWGFWTKTEMFAILRIWIQKLGYDTLSKKAKFKQQSSRKVPFWKERHI